MPKYRVTTDQGVFNVTLDSEPESPEQLRDLVQTHLTDTAMKETQAYQHSEFDRLGKPVTDPKLLATLENKTQSGRAPVSGEMARLLDLSARTDAEMQRQQSEVGRLTNEPQKPVTDYSDTRPRSYLGHLTKEATEGAGEIKKALF